MTISSPPSPVQADEQQHPSPQPSRPPIPEEMLQDRMPEWFRIRPAGFLFAIFLGIIFVFFNARRLYHSDLWGHLAYGRLLTTNGSLPLTEPFLPTAEGVPLVDTAWLSQLIGYTAWQAVGAAGIRCLFGILVTFTCGVILHVVYRKTQSWLWSVIAVVGLLALEWQPWLVVRPQAAGLACFALLICWTLPRQRSSADYWRVPLLMMLWSNLHGSFPCGLVLLVAVATGGFFDAWRRSGRLGHALRTHAFLHPAILFSLALIATLINPYGLRLHATVLSFGNHPNLGNLIEWQPLTLRMKQGMTAAFAALTLAIFYRCSPRRIACHELLLLTGFGLPALWTSRMLVWWAPIAACLIGIHGHAIQRAHARRRRPGQLTRPLAAPPDRRSLWTVCSLGIVFISVSLTPLLVQLKTGKRQPLEEAVSPQTPVAAVQYLNERQELPPGPVFASFGMSDYLAFASRGLRPFVTSHVHLIPEEIWQDHLTATRSPENAAEILDRYGINILLIDSRADASLLRSVRKNSAWQEVFSDNRSVILLRSQPI